MQIKEFISKYRNHPVLFIGTGFSIRYLNNSFTWDELLKKVSSDFTDSLEYYLDVKSRCDINGKYDYPMMARLIEEDFNEFLRINRHGKFKEINDVFYQQMENGINISRFKILISQLLGTLDFRQEKKEEIANLKKIRKNIGSVITTNYDCLIEEIFGFEPLIGNDILLSNPYGSVYKIHGCSTQPSKIIFTADF